MLRSGIRALDQIISRRGSGAKDEQPSELKMATSATLSGPDGSGKSILAMHYASTYASDVIDAYLEAGYRKGGLDLPDGVDPVESPPAFPAILYVSTDLSFGQAERAWAGFGLDAPRRRQDAFDDAYLKFCEGQKGSKEGEKKVWRFPNEPEPGQKPVDLLDTPTIRLRQVKPSIPDAGGDDVSGIESLLDGGAEAENPTVYFLDLHSESAGDDWTYLNELVGLFDGKRKQDAKDEEGRDDRLFQIPNLLIVDAVEGLEAFVGDTDAFGEKRTRRSRVAQLARSCVEAHCHLVFVIEEAVEDRRQPEQFVSDLVIRLRVEHDMRHAIRTLEIEKCRGVAHSHGRHEFFIRSGRGASTGNDKNADHPEIPTIRTGESSKPGDTGLVVTPQTDETKTLAHFRVIHSLHYWNSEFRRLKTPLKRPLGTPSLGRLLSPLKGQMTVSKTVLQSSNSELKHDGSLTLVIGESGTKKSRLGRSFLASGMDLSYIHDDDRKMADGAVSEKTTDVIKGGDEARPKAPISILLTTSLIDKPQLLDLLMKHARADAGDKWAIGSFTSEQVGEKWKAAFKDRILCRRLSVRHQSSSHFLLLVDSYIRRAHQLLDNNTFEEAVLPDHLDVGGIPKETPTPGERVKRRNKSADRIQIVIDDWRSLMGIHPNMDHNPLLLHSLTTLLKSEGVSAMIISTQSGRPRVDTAALPPQDLRKQDEATILTWGVNFFGQNCTAITAVPFRSESEARFIYQIRSTKKGESDGIYEVCDEALEVDDHFELYAGIEVDQPEQIPLTVQLFCGRAQEIDLENTNSFVTVVDQTLSQIFPAVHDDGVVQLKTYTEYDKFFTLADWLDESRLTSTLVLQIDEFWAEGKTSLFNMDSYFEAVVSRWSRRDSEKESVWVSQAADRHLVFQPHQPSEEHWDVDAEKKEMKLSQGIPRITSVDSDDSARPDQVGYKQSVRPKRNGLEEIVGHEATRAGFFPNASVGGPMRRRHKKDPNTKPYASDRVPYLWDMGLIVARRDLWSSCKYREIESSKGGTPILVKDVWNSLCLKDEEFDGPHQLKPHDVTWHDFLACCRLVGETHGVMPFDIDSDTPETIACLMFEIWASLASDGRADPIGSPFKKLSDRSLPKTLRLAELLKGEISGEGELDSLFLALSLLASACPRVRSFHPETSTESPREFAASREWYATACSIADHVSDRRLYSLLALPGRYVSRGDWFLAIAAGSRSRQLGERAIDLLSSRRMNLKRMQEGIGLPVRDILPDSKINELRTALRRGHASGENVPISYGEVCSLGVSDDFCAPERDWLWRSRLRGYDRDSFYWRRWIHRMFESRKEWLNLSDVDLTTLCRENRLHNLADGLQSHRLNSSGSLGATFDDSLKEFVKHVAILVSALRDRRP